MAVPATTGKLCDRIEDMKIGDYIRWYHDGVNYVMNNNTGSMSEIPTEGQSNSISGLAMYWYGVKASKGLIISDRVIRYSWSWGSINSSRSIESKYESISGIEGVIRSLTGGVAYANEFGEVSPTNMGFGAFPSNNEWDRYIVNFPHELIEDGKTLDDVFHWSGIISATSDTSMLGIAINKSSATKVADSSRRTYRGSNIEAGNNRLITDFWAVPSTFSSDKIGFRPIFEYKEV